MKTIMFPGQGSQSKGMGAGLFEQFADRVGEADAILGYSIRELCLEDPRDELGKTQFTQPALYVVNALSWFSKMEAAGPPHFAIGHSLGEFNALMAAGCFDFKTGLKLVQKRGELMGQVSNGAMTAVLNATKDEIEQALKDNGLSNVYLANYNTPSQIVLSGLADEIEKAQKLLHKGKVRCYPLATSGAFHSAFMREAMEKFRGFLQGFELAAPTIPVIANATARPYRDDAILETLATQIASTVRWSESIQYLLAQGAGRGEAVEFEQLGHGDVLTRMVQTVKQQTPQAVLDQILQDEMKPSAQAKDEQAAPAAPAGAADKVSTWNRQHPVGTEVRCSTAPYDSLRTRSEAVVLFGHRPAVYMHGYNGYFDLDELMPA